VTKQTAWERFNGDMRHPVTGEKIDRRQKPKSDAT
jgi:hypothetical protein